MDEDRRYRREMHSETMGSSLSHDTTFDDKAFHWGLMDSTIAFFLLRFLPLSCFSRVSADSTFGCSSKYTKLMNVILLRKSRNQALFVLINAGSKFLRRTDVQDVPSVVDQHVYIRSSILSHAISVTTLEPPRQ